MKQRVFSTIIALLGIAAGAWAGELKIGGYALTPGDYFTRESGFYHLEGGSIEFTDATHVTFTNAELWFSKGNYYAISTDIPNLTITLVGTNTIQGAGVKVGLYVEGSIYVGGNTTITGDGSLEIEEATEDAIQYTSGQNLIIDGATVKVKGARYGVKGSGQSSSFTMKGKARLDAWGDQYCFYGVQQLKNADVSSPSGATFLSSKFGVVDGNSEIIKGQWVTIQPGVAVNATNFPDEIFRSKILKSLQVKDGFLTEEEIADVTSISFIGAKIASLKGIEFFTELTELYCSRNQLTALDVSKNTKLTNLECYGNQLTTLDVSKNTALTKLRCFDNPLTALDLSKNTALTELCCSNNQLASLDVSKNTALTDLRCENNQLASLDVSKNTALTFLWCSDNKLTTLDVSKNTALIALWCSGNQLTALDVSKNTELIQLDCHGNSLRSAAVTALVGSLPNRSQDEDATLFFIYDPEQPEGNIITKPQVAAAKAKGWNVYAKPFSPVAYEGVTPGIDIDATTFPDFMFRSWILNQDYGKDYYLDGDEIAKVTVMKPTDFLIYNLKGIEYFTELQTLHCYKNKLKTLDLSNNTKLENLLCYDNQLTALDVSKNTALTYLNCSYNQLTTLDVSKNTALTDLNCGNNQLASLDVSKNTALTSLSCSNNQLASLDVSKNQNVTEISCYQNIISEYVEAFIKGLPDHKGAAYPLYFCKDETAELGNELTMAQVAAAKKKGWVAKKWDGTAWVDYEGTPMVVVDEKNFPDENFRNWVLSQDFGKDGYIGDEEIALVKRMEISGMSISSLKGIEHFTALNYLDCSFNQLTTLDVSNNTSLNILNCEGNQLTTLDVSKNAGISDLTLDRNLIQGKGMDDLVESLPRINIGHLNIYFDETSAGNRMTEAQVAAAREKYWQPKRWNQDTSEWVDYNGGIAINEVTFPDANFRNWVLAQDYGTDGFLTDEEIEQVTEISVGEKNIASMQGIEIFTALRYLGCSNNQLASLDVSKNTKLKDLHCYSNQLTTLDVSNCTELIHLQCGSNQLTSLDVSNNTALTQLGCSSNQLTSFDVSKNTKLTSLWCDNNQLASLDVSQNTALIQLQCDDNQLTTLNVSNNTALTNLYCRNNKLDALDVSKNTALTDLCCEDNLIRGKQMEAFVNSLTDRSATTEGRIEICSFKTPNNKITPAQVAVAKAKGWKVQIWDDDYVDYEGIVDGDANGDGKVDVADIVAIISHKKGTAVAGFSLLAADINNDGTADEKDIELIRQMIMGE